MNIKVFKSYRQPFSWLNGRMFYRRIGWAAPAWREPPYYHSNYEVAIHTLVAQNPWVMTPDLASSWLDSKHCQLCLICFSFVVSVRFVGWYNEESDCNNYTAGWYHQSQYSPTVTIPPSPSHNTGEHRDQAITQHTSRQYQHIWYFTDGWRDQDNSLTPRFDRGGRRFPWRYRT